MDAFKKKLQSDKEIRIVAEDMMKFKEFRDIGDRFNYIDIEFIVESHFVKDIDGKVFSEMETVYKGSNGDLMHYIFPIRLLPALRAENSTQQT